MLLSIPWHPKNWLILLSEYVITFPEETSVPVWAKPTVESTDITDDPELTVDKTLVFGVIPKVPLIKSLSLYPTKRPTL